MVQAGRFHPAEAKGVARETDWGEHPIATNAFLGLLEDMETDSGRWDQSDSVLIPENTLQSLLGVSGPDLRLETSHLANENGWTATRTTDGHWQFERKGS